MKKMKLNIQLFATNGNLGTLSGDWKTTYTVTWSLVNQSIENNESYIDLTATFYTGNSTTIASSYSNFKLDGETIYSGAYTKKGAGNIFVKTKRITIKHNDDGSFPGRSVTFSTNDYIMGSQSGSGTITGVSDIKRTSNLEKPKDFNIGDTISLNVTKYSSSFKDNLAISLNNTNIKIIKDYNSGDEITFTEEELDKIYGLLPNVKKGIFTFIINTKNENDELVGIVMQNSTGTIIDADPIFNDFDFADINPTTVKLLEGEEATTSQKVVLGYSKVQVTIPVASKAVAQKKATMVNYRFNNNEVNYSDTDDVSITSNNVTSGEFVVYAIDSRTNASFALKSAINVINYIPLQKGNITVNRENGVSENVVLKFDATIDLVDFGAKINSVTSAQYRYKVASETEWSELKNITVQVDDNGKITFNSLIEGDTETLGFNIQNAYNIEVYLKDELSEVKYTANFGAGIPHIAFAKNGVGIMGKYDESVGGLLQVGGQKLNIPNVYNTYSDSKTDVYSCDYVNDKFDNLNIYSTEEQRIGTWIDGKPLYRKIISVTTTIELNKVLSIDTGISNAEMIWIDRENSYIYNNNNTVSGGRNCYPIPFNVAPSETSTYIGARMNGNKIELLSNGGWNTIWTKVITVKYTKSTD